MYPDDAPAVTPPLGSSSTAPLDERIKQLEEELARREKVNRLQELEDELHGLDEPEEVVQLRPEPDGRPQQIKLHPVHCDACGHPYGALEAPDAVVLCREGCTHAYRLPPGDPGRKRGAKRREVSSEYAEHRRVFCGMCTKRLGHVRMVLKGAPTPSVFCSQSCAQAWEDQGRADPKGGGRAR